MSFRTIDFPAPLAPSSMTIEPFGTAKLKLLSTT